MDMDDRLVQIVRLRAAFQCEYCLLPERDTCGFFEIEHIFPQQHGGTNFPKNLAWACRRCNRYKGTNLAGFDPTGTSTRLIRLFHPRLHKWNRHFLIDGSLIRGRTAIGRVTVNLLSMNEEHRVALREELIRQGLFAK